MSTINMEKVVKEVSGNVNQVNQYINSGCKLYLDEIPMTSRKVELLTEQLYLCKQDIASCYDNLRTDDERLFIKTNYVDPLLHICKYCECIGLEKQLKPATSNKRQKFVQQKEQAFKEITLARDEVYIDLKEFTLTSKKFIESKEAQVHLADFYQHFNNVVMKVQDISDPELDSRIEILTEDLWSKYKTSREIEKKFANEEQNRKMNGEIFRTVYRYKLASILRDGNFASVVSLMEEYETLKETVEKFTDDTQNIEEERKYEMTYFTNIIDDLGDLVGKEHFTDTVGESVEKDVERDAEDEIRQAFGESEDEEPQPANRNQELERDLISMIQPIMNPTQETASQILELGDTIAGLSDFANHEVGEIQNLKTILSDKYREYEKIESMSTKELAEYELQKMLEHPEFREKLSEYEEAESEGDEEKAESLGAELFEIVHNYKAQETKEDEEFEKEMHEFMDAATGDVEIENMENDDFDAMVAMESDQEMSNQ